MVLFPHCKINIGLDILDRRADGYHDIETVMLPVKGLCDILEIVRPDESIESAGDKSVCSGIDFTSSGLAVDCPSDKNICVKAYNIMAERYGIGSVRMHLHKAIPFGAGLGGGSSDAAFVIKGLNGLFGLGLDDAAMRSLAAETGSDTAFFIGDVAQIAGGRGEILSPVSLPLSGKTLVIVKPPVGISTAEAYSGVKPQPPAIPLTQRISAGISSWRETIRNDFEGHIFAAHPELAAIKERLHSLGAVYASMSGSGSAIYGIFGDTLPEASGNFPGMFVHQEVII